MEHPAHAMKADYEFHRAIAAASGNPFYSDCLASLGQTMIAMPRTRLMTGTEHYARDHFEQVVHEHDPSMPPSRMVTNRRRRLPCAATWLTHGDGSVRQVGRRRRAATAPCP